jgi:hypothetical protein
MSTPTQRGPEPSNRAIIARLAALEARMADLEGPISESQYRMRREVIANRIETGRIIDHLGLAGATEQEIDDYLDRE